jgi:toxin CptA
MTAAGLRIRIEPSRYLAGGLALAHVLGWVALYPLALPEMLKLALAAAIAVSAVHSIATWALLRSRYSIVALDISGEQVAIRERHTAQWQACHVLGTTFVSPCLTVLNLRLLKDGTIRHGVIVPDSVDRNDFRRLRVRLRWSALAGVQQDASRNFFGRPATHADWHAPR